MIRVVNKKNHTPTDKDHYIGRGSFLGNSFTHIPIQYTKAKYLCKSREEAIQKYRVWIKEHIKDGNIRKELNNIYTRAKSGDVNLVCYCYPKPCHGNIIKELIEDEL